MRILQWIVVLASIALLVIFGFQATGASLIEDGGLSPRAFNSIVWIGVTYLATKVFFLLKK